MLTSVALKVIHTRIPEELHDWLGQIATEGKVSKQAALEAILSRARELNWGLTRAYVTRQAVGAKVVE
jgi:hypothetical protein